MNATCISASTSTGPLRTRLLLSLTFLLPIVHGQETTLHTTVPLHVVPVSVEDRKGRPVAGLQPSDFVLFDNGQPLPATVDVSDVSATPVAMVVLIQTNDFAHSVLGKIRKVGSMIPEAVTGENSRAAVVTFDDQVVVRQELTNDTDSVADSFRTLKSTDALEAKLLDAVVVALDLLRGRPAGERQSILILGQSQDRGVKLSWTMFSIA